MHPEGRQGKALPPACERNLSQAANKILRKLRRNLAKEFVCIAKKLVCNTIGLQCLKILRITTQLFATFYQYWDENVGTHFLVK